MISAADLALNKFHAVVHKIADRRICKSGCRRIFFCPGNHPLRGIHMCNGRPRFCTGHRSSSRIGEQIQYFDRASGAADQSRCPVPIDCLLRKKSCMFKTKWFQMEGQIPVMDIPLLRQIKELPFSASLIASMIVRIFLLPLWGIMRCVPDHLRVRANQDIISPSL